MSDENTVVTNSDSSAAGPDKDFLEMVVKAIVDNPDDVLLERNVDDLGVLIKLRVNEADMSKVVGKGGQTAKALRTLLRLVGSKYDFRTNLKILEPDGSEQRFSTSSVEPKQASKPIDTIDESQTKDSTSNEEVSEDQKKNDDATSAFDNII